MKSASRFPKLFPLLLAILLSLGLASCASSASRGTTYAIDPDLKEFYNTLGGKDRLGPAISKLFPFNESNCQYTPGALLCHNPELSGAAQYFLYPLGSTLMSSGTIEAETPDSTNLVVNGIPIYAEFIPLYKELSGASITGYPLAPAKMNYSQQRIEQYFENLGLYRNFSDAAGDVKLLAYGAAACADRCDFSPAVDAVISSSTIPQTDRVFLEGLEKLGDASIFGAPLTRAFLAADGMQEQVFENASLFTSPGSKFIHLRSVPLIVGMPSTPPGAKLYGNKEGMVFYAVDGSLGYHVPQLFDDFIAEHGGTAISGMPIAEVTQLSAGQYRQCFENYCLRYATANPPETQLTLDPIGASYLAKISPADFYGETVVISPSTVALKVKEQYHLLQPKQMQQLSITLRSQVNDQPLVGIEAQLKVSLPDGSVYEGIVPATMANGTSSINVPFLEDAPNGSILHYQICLTGIIAEPVCATGSYVQMKLP